MGRYDNLILNSGQYIPQYAGIPLDEIRSTADKLSERHYQNLANLNRLELLAEQYKAKMLPGAREYVDSHINDISLALQDVARNGGENATARVGAITNKFLGDQGILKGLQQAEAVGREIELENNLIGQGKMPIRRKGLREAMMQASIIGEDGELNPLYLQPYQSTVAPYEDPIPHMKRIWDEIQPDSIEGILHAADKTTLQDLLGKSVAAGAPDIPLFFESLTKAGIGKDKIDKMLNSAWSSYQQTPGFRQAIDYAEDPVAEREAQKKRFYNHGLLNVYNNISRQYMNNTIADDLIRGKKQTDVAFPTQAPAQTVETLFNYNADGINKSLLSDAGASAGTSVGPMGAMVGTGKSKVATTEELDPQYVKDVKTMSEISGVAAPDPKSNEAKQLAAQYKQLVGKRVSHPWVMPTSADAIRDANFDLQSQYDLYQYMDPKTGEVIEAFDHNGKPTDKFVELTGGDPKEFKIGYIYDPKNHFTVFPASGERFVRPASVKSVDKDGNLKNFIISQAARNTTPDDINTNAIYTKVNLRPGQMTEVHPRVQARELHGKQLDEAIRSGALTAEDITRTTMPIEATVDGETFIFDSPEHLSNYLTQKGIQLSIR